MIRLIFRTLVDGRFKYHTTRVEGHDVDLLATDKTAEYVGAEKLYGDSSNFAEHVARLRAKANPAETPVAEVSSDGGFVVPSDLATSLEKVVCEDRRAMSPEELGKAEEIGKAIAEIPGVLYGEGLKLQLWLFMRPSGEFVKSTTEEGGESYIACTSLDEAQKVVEQQKIYDIDCVPHRVF